MAVSNRIPAVTGTRPGMWRGAQALRRPLKRSGPPLSASLAGRLGSVRDASQRRSLAGGRLGVEAPISPLLTVPSMTRKPLRNKDFRRAFGLPMKGEAIDIKETFTLCFELLHRNNRH